MKLLLLVVGMVLILEGLPYVAAPEAMKEWLRKLSEAEPQTLRVMGAFALATGFLICFLVQKTSFFS